MKTNRELFLKELEEADMDYFVRLITGYNKCARCSNFYWDGNYTECHKDKNNSSCEEGIAQHMKSKVGENLQVKYHKKYSAFRSYFHAMLGKQLANILFQSDVVDKLEPTCEYCESSECSECDRFWCNILDMSREYAYNLVEPYSDDDHSHDAIKARELSKKYYQNDMIFISEILLQQIQDPALYIQAKLLTELLLKDDEAL